MTVIDGFQKKPSNRNKKKHIEKQNIAPKRMMMMMMISPHSFVNQPNFCIFVSIHYTNKQTNNNTDSTMASNMLTFSSSSSFQVSKLWWSEWILSFIHSASLSHTHRESKTEFHLNFFPIHCSSSLKKFFSTQFRW